MASNAINATNPNSLAEANNVPNTIDPHNLANATKAEKKAYKEQIEAIYQAASNGAMVLPSKLQDQFFAAMTSWIRGHMVGCEEYTERMWTDCRWQADIIRYAHEKWTDTRYAESDSEDDE